MLSISVRRLALLLCAGGICASLAQTPPNECAPAGQSPDTRPKRPPLVEYLDNPKPFTSASFLSPGETEEPQANTVFLNWVVTARVVSMRPFVLDVLDVAGSVRPDDRAALCGPFTIALADAKLKEALADLQFNQIVKGTLIFGGNSEFPNSVVLTELSPSALSEGTPGSCPSRSGLVVSYRAAHAHLNIHNDGAVSFTDSLWRTTTAPRLSHDELTSLMKAFADSGFDKVPSTLRPTGDVPDQDSLTLICARDQYVSLPGKEALLAPLLERLEQIKARAVASAPRRPNEEPARAESPSYHAEQNVPPAQEKPPGWPVGARIPEISGQLVDAITGRPVPNIDVTLRARGVLSFGGGETIRYENSHTAPDGRFRFATSLEKQLARLLTKMEGYWLSVNIAFLTPEQLKKADPSGDPESDGYDDDLSREVRDAPLAHSRYPHRAEPQLRKWNNGAYFPIAVQFVRPCDQKWNANCLYSPETKDLRIALIPVLDDPAGCGKIADRAIADQCRQLNTFRAAFRHTASVEDFAKSKDLCRQIGDGKATETCLEVLRFLDHDLFDGRVTEEHRIAAILVMDPIAGLTPWGPSGMLGGGEPDMHEVSYRRPEHNDVLTAAVARVWLTPAANDRRKAIETIKAWTGRAVESKAMLGGKPIGILESARKYVAFWTSRGTVVALTFYKVPAGGPKPVDDCRQPATEASAATRRTLIRAYLLRHPPAR